MSLCRRRRRRHRILRLVGLVDEDVGFRDGCASEIIRANAAPLLMVFQLAGKRVPKVLKLKSGVTRLASVFVASSTIAALMAGSFCAAAINARPVRKLPLHRVAVASGREPLEARPELRRSTHLISSALPSPEPKLGSFDQSSP